MGRIALIQDHGTAMNDSEDVTQLLADWRKGDPQALNRLIPRVYADLRAMASRRVPACA